MTIQKQVNGVLMDMTPEEETAALAVIALAEALAVETAQAEQDAIDAAQAEQDAIDAAELQAIADQEAADAAAIVAANEAAIIQELADAAYLADTIPRVTREKQAELKGIFDTNSLRPRVDVSLGFAVDGSYNDLANFEIGKDLGLLAVKDADGITRPIILSDYDIIILSIKTHGLLLLQNKWVHEDAILLLEAAAVEADIVSYDVTVGWP